MIHILIRLKVKHNGTNGQSASAQPAPITTPNPPTPPPAPLLRPVGSRQIKQKEIVKEKSLNEQLMEQIRKSTSVSDEYIFDGSNQEVVPRQNVRISYGGFSYGYRQSSL